MPKPGDPSIGQAGADIRTHARHPETSNRTAESC
jgi:hypothetical protein